MAHLDGNLSQYIVVDVEKLIVGWWWQKLWWCWVWISDYLKATVLNLIIHLLPIGCLQCFILNYFPFVFNWKTKLCFFMIFFIVFFCMQHSKWIYNFLVYCSSLLELSYFYDHGVNSLPGFMSSSAISKDHFKYAAMGWITLDLLLLIYLPYNLSSLGHLKQNRTKAREQKSAFN